MGPDSRFCPGCGRPVTAASPMKGKAATSDGDGSLPPLPAPAIALPVPADDDEAGPTRGSRSRPLTLATAAIVVVLVAVVLLALRTRSSPDVTSATAPRSPDTQATTEPSEPAAPAPAVNDDGRDAPTLSDAEVATLIGCVAPDCEVGGTSVIDHPDWGGSLFVATGGYGSLTLAVIDGNRQVRWEQSLDGWYPLDAPVEDDLGHVFVEYTSGAGGTSGVIVLAPTIGGMEDFDSLPSGIESGVYFGAGGDGVEDVDGDGVLEMLVGENNCVPDCAGGFITNTVYRWDGTGYRPQ